MQLKDATVFGIDNNMRKGFFGKDGSTEWRKEELVQKLNGQYVHINADIRDERSMKKAFLKAGKVDLVVHCASQPAHDWAAKDPELTLRVNAGRNFKYAGNLSSDVTGGRFYSLLNFQSLRR
jgi:CDP-paratose 2-epimerase